ncbi:MAG: NADH-quinone oxidoreductase subunit NuoB [Deltaproteobacteria bacterium]|nr:NADH-quinone oxidoreductase subunit NuoB [Deltaproteobacteria bacterium]
MGVEEKGKVPLLPSGVPVGSKPHATDSTLFAQGRPKPLSLDESVAFIKNWFRAQSLNVMAYGTGCGSIELGPLGTSRFDMERFGITGGPTPRQSSVLIISGYLSVKTLKRVIRSYEQMPNPRWVVALGSCTINGGMYWDSYSTIKILDQYLPVDVYVNGCMPRPEALIAGFKDLMDMIKRGEANGYIEYQNNLDWYRANQRKVIKDWNLPEYSW